MDYGTSFAGQSIASAIRLPFNYLKSPLHKKRFRKLLLEMQADEPTEITVATDFDYAAVSGDVLDVDSGGGGGMFGAAIIGTVRFGSALYPGAEINISGVGRNIGIVLYHDSAAARPFQSMPFICNSRFGGATVSNRYCSYSYATVDGVTLTAGMWNGAFAAMLAGFDAVQADGWRQGQSGSIQRADCQL